MDVQDLDIYKSAVHVGDRIWSIVMKWDRFGRNALGTQIIRAADSVAANLSEGFGQYHFRENRQFCYYARGSLCELRTRMQRLLRVD